MNSLQLQNLIFLPSGSFINEGSGPGPGVSDRVTEASEQRITESGENRIIE
jgi:hypothetical protein